MHRDTHIETFMHAARQCAMLMMSNAQYIERELPNVRLPDGMESRLRAACAALIATKHDVISELFELGEVKEAGATQEEITRRVNRIIGWLGETVDELNEAGTTLQKAAETDFSLSLAFILVAESAIGILNAFTETAEAAHGSGLVGSGRDETSESELP